MEVVPPIAAFKAIVGKDRVGKEDLQPVEVCAKPVEDGSREPARLREQLGLGRRPSPRRAPGWEELQPVVPKRGTSFKRSQ